MRPKTAESEDGRPLRTLAIEEPVPALAIALAFRPSLRRSPVVEAFTAAAVAFLDRGEDGNGA